MPEKKRYIIGLGNYSKNDDSIGLRIVEHIVDNNLDTDFQAIEVGNDGMRLLNYFAPETEKILVLDCALMDKKPGDYVLFNPDEVSSRKQAGKISTHEGDILKIIDLAKQLDYPVPLIRCLAIEPKSLEMDMTLSGILQKKIEEYVQIAIEEIRKE